MTWLLTPPAWRCQDCRRLMTATEFAGAGWACSGCGSGDVQIDDDAPTPPPTPRVFARCECGAEKTYGPNATHSRWCPKGKT